MSRLPPRALGPSVKIKRSVEHFKDLQPKVAAFNDGNAYRFVTEFDAKTREHVIRIRVAKYPDALWAAMIGDIVHNLRSALDLLACQLVLANNGTVTKRTCFPIFDSGEKFKTGYVGKVSGASKEALAFIEALEPYQGGNGDALWRLHELSIADKHKLLLPIFGLFPEQIGRVIVEYPGQPTEKKSHTWKRVFPLVDGTEITRVFTGGDETQVKVNMKGAVRIAFGEPKCVECEPIIPYLKQLGQFVEGVIQSFYPFLI